MTRETRYFPYRFGEALWAYIGGTYGDGAIIDLFRRSLRMGWDPALESTLGLDSDSLSANWAELIKAQYLPLMEDRQAPSDVGTLLLAPGTGAGSQNLAPALSPDGKRLVYMSEKDLFSFDLFLADAKSGRTEKTLSNASADPHFDALRFVDSSGSWSWDGTRLAFVVFADGDNELVVADAGDGDVQRRIAVDGIGAMQGPSWSPDGQQIVFSGSAGGITDIYLYDLSSDVTTKLTNDKNADFQPVFSPDGRQIAFVTDKAPDTNFDLLKYSKFQLALLDLQTGRQTTLQIFGDKVKHINPQYSPDGKYLYFISDWDGFSDIYRLELEAGNVERITNVATGVSGITWSSPAMTVAQESGEIAFSVFDEFEFHVFTLTPEQMDERAEFVVAVEPGPGRNLPPMSPRVPSMVSSYLSDAETGLEPPGTYLVEDAEPFNSHLQLDYVGQPSIGVGADNFGTYLGGSASAYFSDMLGDRFLGVAVAAQGTFKDIGGQFMYLNQKNRWNWGYGAGRIPYQYLYYTYGTLQSGGVTYDVLAQRRYRLYNDYAAGLLAYPFSTTRRLEANVGFSRYSVDIEEDQILYQGGIPVDTRRVQLDSLEYDPFNIVQASVALVGDNSFTAFTSPVRGGRYRFEVATAFGTARYQTITADYRRYFSPNLNFTLAVRGLHYGRYNYTTDLVSNSFIRPLFLGYETLIRGYAWESFDANECGGTTDGSCPTFDRLFGQRLAVGNIEARVPFIGTDQFGLINLPYVPVELVAFTDVGIAWDNEHPADWTFSRSSTARVPLVSSGLSARFNILGILILEAYYAYPWQRPLKGWHWGFNLAPGW